MMVSCPRYVYRFVLIVAVVGAGWWLVFQESGPGNSSSTHPIRAYSSSSSRVERLNPRLASRSGNPSPRKAFPTSTSLDGYIRRQRNSEVPQYASVLRNASDRRWAPDRNETFSTDYTKIYCGAVVANFCFWTSQPRYFRAGAVPFTQSGATKMCNEATVKHRLNMVMYEPPLRPPRDYLRDGVLVVPFCWELYGYHLLLCLLAMHRHLTQLGFYDARYRSLRVFVAQAKGMGMTPYFVGSNTSWDDPVHNPPETASKAKPSRYWALWRLLTDSPARVWALPDVPPLCFGLGIFGSPPSTESVPRDSVAMREELLAALGVADYSQSIRTNCGRYSTLIVQRTTMFQIRNVDVVAATFQRVVGGNVTVVHFEEMPLRDQLAAVLHANVLVGIHGNGLSWGTMMKPASVMVELWPKVPYNANYYYICLRANLLHLSVNGDGQCSRRCSANFNVEEAAKEARRHLDEVACHKGAFNTSKEFFVRREESIRKKRNKVATA